MVCRSDVVSVVVSCGSELRWCCGGVAVALRAFSFVGDLVDVNDSTMSRLYNSKETLVTRVQYVMYRCAVRPA